MKMNNEGRKEVEVKKNKNKKLMMVLGVLLDVVDIQNLIVTFLQNNQMVKVKKKCNEVYGGPPAMKLVNLIRQTIILYYL
jgi:hypothetical protein